MGEISEDILDYLSSRKADQRIFLADLLVDRAHLVMLKEMGQISEEVASKIIAALDEIEEGSALGAGEDVHEAIEAAVIALVGPEGGRMHTGRSRNDEVATCIRIALRDDLLDLMDGGSLSSRRSSAWRRITGNPSSLGSLTPSMLSPPPWPIIYWPMPMLPFGIWIG